MAGVRIVMRTHADLVQRHQAAQPLVHPVNLHACLRAPGDVWLIGYDDKNEAGPPQVSAGLHDPWQQAELFQ